MNVIGVLVNAGAGRAREVAEALAAMDGVEVHAVEDDGRIVVTAEDAGAHFASDSLMAMNHIPGVISTSLVYHAHEPDDAPAIGRRAAA